MHFQTLPWSTELWRGVPGSDWLCGGGGERDGRSPQRPGGSEAQLSAAPRPVCMARAWSSLAVGIITHHDLYCRTEIRHLHCSVVG